MLYRKIENYIADHFTSSDERILIIEGARQVGKSYIIREVGRRMFKHFHEINFIRDEETDHIFKNISSIDDFYLVLSSIFPDELGDYSDTLIFLDEIQHYPQYLTWLKFLKEDHRYRFVGSGSMLGMALHHTTSVPVGSLIIKKMFQLDFEEFLIANSIGANAIEALREAYLKQETPPKALHDLIMPIFLRYLLVGGMPDAVNAYIKTHNIAEVRNVQSEIHALYKADASKYEHDYGKRLCIQRIYDMIPSQMENLKKRIMAKDIKGKEGDRFDRYNQEFEYLLASGIAIGVTAVTNPKFPLESSVKKNLIKLYLNDVGLLTNILYRNNIMPILNSESSVNLGSVYENYTAMALCSQGTTLHYYGQKKVGEVDFMVDDFMTTSALPVEVKSGKSYKVHSALDRLMSISEYNIKYSIVLSNSPEVRRDGNIIYMPIYFAMFLCESADNGNSLCF